MVSNTNMINRLFEEQLHALRIAYVADLQRTLAHLQSFAEQLRVGQAETEMLAALQHIAHGLAGSGATYGFTQVSDLAGRLDRNLATFTEVQVTPNNSQRIYITALLTDLITIIADLPHQEPTKSIRIVAPLIAAEPTQQVVICDSDSVIAEDLARQIANFGYYITVVSDQAALVKLMREQVPAAIIIDIALMKDLDQLIVRESSPPLIVTAAQDDFATRLHAVRAGSAAFFAKPIDTSTLVDTLDSLTDRDEANPYRILIIDDQPLLAATYATTLRQAGMLVSTVTNPLRIMSALSEFHPDVLLLDMYMPGCTGIELATVLRQQTAFEGIPIVFLSAETQIDRQMDALKRGGDDFLTKPIQLDHLVAAVASRAHRARKLRSAMTRDSLTGLYNHTTTKEHLKRELSRASRLHRTLTFAMIDIDQFKAVNDTHGHVVGDHVIKSLSRLLKQRLRQSDIVGRYGGEEFALVLPDTDEQMAFELLEELRQRFARIRQHAHDLTFASTFSCGIASFPESLSLASLISAADQALYHAKQSGRNQVIPASSRPTE